MVARGGMDSLAASVHLRLCNSISYWGVRCSVCSTVQDCAQPIHAKFTHEMQPQTIDDGNGRIARAIADVVEALVTR